jgi:hypothetical protein
VVPASGVGVGEASTVGVTVPESFVPASFGGGGVDASGLGVGLVDASSSSIAPSIMTEPSIEPASPSSIDANHGVPMRAATFVISTWM